MISKVKKLVLKLTDITDMSNIKQLKGMQKLITSEIASRWNLRKGDYYTDGNFIRRKSDSKIIGKLTVQDEKISELNVMYTFTYIIASPFGTDEIPCNIAGYSIPNERLTNYINITKIIEHNASEQLHGALAQACKEVEDHTGCKNFRTISHFLNTVFCYTTTGSYKTIAKINFKLAGMESMKDTTQIFVTWDIEYPTV